MAQEWFNNLINGVDFRTFKTTIKPYLEELRNSHFTFDNPVLWVLFLILLFILSRSWGMRKAFSYCLIVTAILLVTTQLEQSWGSTLAKSEVFDVTVLKMISAFVIVLLSIYFFFIKSD
jgi:hypothetical protein